MNSVKHFFLLACALFSLAALSACDEPTTSEKVDNAVEDLKDGRGVGESVEELEDRTTGERIGDAVEDAGQDVQDAAEDASEE